MESKAYYIDINRFSAQDSESSQTNIWDYKLNDTIVAPAGSAISIHQAFINQKGITGQSIEIEEDINETIQYYVYVTEDLQPIPVAQTPLETHQFSPYGRNSHLVNSVNLLNNTDIGRSPLFNVELNVGYKDLYHPTYVGGCGCPLILSSKPALDGTTLQSITGCDYTSTAADFETGQHVVLTNGQTSMTCSNPTTLPSKVKVGTGITGTGIAGSTTIAAIAADRKSATLSANFTGTTGTITNIAYSNTQTNIIKFEGEIPVGLSVGNRIVDFSGHIPLNTGVKAVNADNVTMKNLATGADAFPTGTSNAPNGSTLSFYTDPSFYVQPVPTQAFITVTKGVYGIEQLVNIINRQLTNQYKSGTEIPISNIESALAGKIWDGMINTNNSGFTRIVTPIQYRQSPDQVKVADVDPAVAPAAGIPTHTLIPALDYSKNLDSFHSKFEPTKINFTNRVNSAHADKGYIAYLQDNNTTCYNGTNNTISDPALKHYDSYTPEKYASDYRIGTRGLTVGSPEINIQYNTDLSGFSLNNLHANYRIASHDLMGNPNEQVGEIAVGLKRMCDILDAAPYSQNQSIFGFASGTHNIDMVISNGTNTASEVTKRGTVDSAAEFLQVGASITGTGIPANTFITEIQADETKGTAEFGFRMSNNCTATGKQTDVTITPNPLNFQTTTALKNSWEKPVSRTGGCIIYNFAKQTAIKYGNNSSVVNDITFRSHASFEEFFTDKNLAKKIWKTKTLWGKLGFTYDQLNSTDYFEEIVQYNHPVDQKLRGITTDTKLDVSVIPTISTLTNPSDYLPDPIHSAATNNIKNPQTYNNFDFCTPRTQRTVREYAGDKKDTTPYSGDNYGSYAGSRYELATMINVVAKPTPITAEQLPTLSQFGYYLITSDLVPTYKDIVARGDPLGLLGVVAKSNLSNQDFIPKTESDIIQVLDQDTIINNIRVKILNPDLSNPQLNDNSSVILKIAVPINNPVPPVPPNKSTAEKNNKKKEKKI